MAQDFCLQQENSSLFDMTVDPDIKGYKTVDGMETAVNFQLFVNQRVTKEERANAQDREGWIGDMLTRGEGYQVGSLLHLKEQARDTPLDNNETASYAKNALEYFVEIGASKEISAGVNGKNIEGQIINEANEVSRYSKLWKSTTTCSSEQIQDKF